MVSFSVRAGMVRRKSTSPAKQATCRKEKRPQRLRLWGELGEEGLLSCGVLLMVAEVWQQ
jgi:hypothetical protein